MTNKFYKLAVDGTVLSSLNFDKLPKIEIVTTGDFFATNTNIYFTMTVKKDVNDKVVPVKYDARLLKIEFKNGSETDVTMYTEGLNGLDIKVAEYIINEIKRYANVETAQS